MQGNIAAVFLALISLAIYYAHEYRLIVTWRIVIVSAKELPSLPFQSMTIEALLEAGWTSLTAMKQSAVDFMESFVLPVLRNKVR